ncbi:FxSxx-COOH system tetratricopeptide repeat protein [Kitasatospora sp. NPDC092948]|uniref:FxSxx-COOH system tetratricopeptide repeat protein n=1 Tax=Kitasatospora sp. NPDC092948 TaxID=3364088 RepID=UPI0038147715
MVSPEASGERAIAGQYIGTAITGDVIGLPGEILNAARDVQAPPGLTNLPPAPLCLGRDEELARLREALAEGGDTAITRAATVHGLGGVGKTTLALAYAHRYRHAHSTVWWINADSPTRIEQSLAELTRRLLPGPAADPVAWAMAWLQWHPGWLLVFDNVEAVADLSPYLGALGGGRHLITSRRAVGWPRTVRTLALGTLDPDRAAELIRAAAYGDDEPTARELQDVRALAAELGYLPLALEQAGAYLRQNPTVTVAAYHRRLPTKLDKAADGLDAERTMARIWTQTLDALTARNPRAVELLHTLAWLAPDGTPVGLLETDGEDPDAVHEALGDLAAYSMATVTRHAVSVHRLVQQVLRTGADGAAAGRLVAERALVRALDGLDPEADDRDPLIPHLIALAETRPAGHHDEAVTEVYYRAARRLDIQGHTARTVALYEAVLAQCEQGRGDLHPDTLAARGNLARARTSAGDLRRALPLYEQALAQREQVFGELHAETLRSRHNLAFGYLTSGDPRRAVPLFEQVVAEHEQVLGELHPDTLMARNNLGGAYLAAGEAKRAALLFEAVVAQRARLLGDSHAETLDSRSDLVDAYLRLGDTARAVTLGEMVLAQREQVLGELHPHALTSRAGLADAHLSAGDLCRALPLLELVLAQREQVLGELHLHTLMSRSRLACGYVMSGDGRRALPLLELVLAQREQLLGEEHPVTLMSRSNLAFGCARIGETARAARLYATVLDQRTRVLGERHPDTVAVRDRLATVRRADTG